MSKNEMLEQVKTKANAWLNGNYNEETKQQIRDLMENNEAELIECFYKDLEFGTGGLRGIMGVGTNRMNIYTIGMATQGLCNYLKMNYGETADLKVAIAYDCRNNGKMFAETTANIFAANKIKVYLFDSLRPTPELSFAIRHFGCQSGVVLTASHNPKEYNGYKAYGEDGGQLTAPHDVNVVNEARKITNVDEIKFTGNEHLITIIGEEFDKIYLNELHSLSLCKEAVAQFSNMKIVYTPIHGTGVQLVPAILKKFGFNNIYNIPAQDITDGNFPTVISPNPENAEALTMALAKAKEVDAELILATDPDADRVAVAVKDDSGNYLLLNGNQTGAILIYYLLSNWKQLGKLNGKEYVVKTIVTTELIRVIAEKFGVEYFDVLTGFKYIAEIIKENEGKKHFIGGGEESYGYLAGEFVRDKDAIMSCALIAEATAWAKSNGKTLYDLLQDIYVEFGFYKESLINIEKKGKAGAEEIEAMMEAYRKNPPKEIAGHKVLEMKDYQFQKTTNLINGTVKPINLPKSNVLQFITEDESKISIRPSGTEPKIKFYFGVKAALSSKSEFEKANAETDSKIKAIIQSLGLK